jgi:hypothetical protein
LRRKAEHLVTHRQAWFSGGKKAVAARRQRDTDLPGPLRQIVAPDGRRSAWFKCEGDYSPVVFVSDLPDIDWVTGGGFGVSMDIPGPSQDQSELLEMLEQFSHLGWMTAESAWSIQQIEANWHGAGAKSFAEVLSDWRGRYEGLTKVHHTEEFCFFDVCEGGFFTLTGQIGADDRRQVWHLNVSFQLSGVPLDQGPLLQLCRLLDPPGVPLFRPRGESSVKDEHLSLRDRPRLEVLASVVQFDESDPDEPEWVTGLVVVNPYLGRRHPSWWPPALGDLEVLQCDLRSWHPLGVEKRTYRLWSCSWAWTSDAIVVRPRADWDDPKSGGRRRRDVPSHN